MIPTTVAEAARRYGDRIAYVAERRLVALVRRHLHRISDEVAVGLAAAGLGVGDVLGLVLPPGPDYLLAYCAAAKIARSPRAWNDRLSTRERDAVLALARPKLTIDQPDALLRDHQAAGALPRLSPTIPNARWRSSSRREPRDCRRARSTANRQLTFITQIDTGGAWDTGGRSFQRHLVRAPRLHDEAARQPPTGRHHVHHGALARGPTRSRCSHASR